MQAAQVHILIQYNKDGEPVALQCPPSMTNGQRNGNCSPTLSGEPKVPHLTTFTTTLTWLMSIFSHPISYKPASWMGVMKIKCHSELSRVRCKCTNK